MKPIRIDLTEEKSKVKRKDLIVVRSLSGTVYYRVLTEDVERIRLLGSGVNKNERRKSNHSSLYRQVERVNLSYWFTALVTEIDFNGADWSDIVITI